MERNRDKHGHHKYKVCVSGAAETGHCGVDALDKAKELGREIARRDIILNTGATTGFPLWVAMGAKEESGVVIGMSPAATEHEHVEVFRLPVDYHDLIIYTGFGYPGRDILLTRSSDAVIVGCGRIGTIHEFTVAFEDKKPIGVLRGEWDTDETFQMILDRAHRANDKIVFDDDPKRLMDKVVALIDANKVHEFDI